jgi:hypothetical protein
VAPRRLAGAIPQSPFRRVPTYRAVTSGNRVIYSASIEYMQGVESIDLFAIGVDGSNPVRITDSHNEDRFCASPGNGQIFYTERYTGSLGGVSVPRGDVYVVNDDGTGKLSLRNSVAHYDDVCLGVTGSNVVFGRRYTTNSRYIDDSDALFTVPTYGGEEVLVAPYISGQAVTFSRTTPSNRVLYGRYNTRPLSPTVLHSVQSDGANDVVLDNTPLPTYAAGVTWLDNVLYYRWDGRQSDIFIVNAGGGVPNPVATQPESEWVKLIY